MYLPLPPPRLEAPQYLLLPSLTHSAFYRRLLFKSLTLLIEAQALWKASIHCWHKIKTVEWERARVTACQGLPPLHWSHQGQRFTSRRILSTAPSVWGGILAFQDHIKFWQIKSFDSDWAGNEIEVTPLGEKSAEWIIFLIWCRNHISVREFSEAGDAWSPNTGLAVSCCFEGGPGCVAASGVHSQQSSRLTRPWTGPAKVASVPCWSNELALKVASVA